MGVLLPMRVTHWNMRFFPLMGGIGTYISSLIRNMPDVEFDIVTNALRGSPLSERFADNATISRFPPYDPVILFWNRWGRKALVPPAAAAENLRTLREKRYLRANPPDLIHFHDIDTYTVEVLRLLGSPRRFIDRYARMYHPDALPAPTLLTKHFDTMLIPNSVWALWERLFTLQFRNIIVLTKAREDFWKREFREAGVDSRIWLIPNGVDMDMFRPSERSPSRELRIGYAGRLDKLKGEQLLEGILKDLPEGVVFHGAFPGEERLPSWLSDLPKKTCKLDFDIPYERMPDFYKSVDVMINTTVIRSTDRTITEPMACGTPVIKAMTGDDFPVVDGETGMLVPPVSQEFSRAITRVQQDRGILDSLSRRTRKVILDNFDAKNVTARVREVYNSLAG